MNRSLCHLCQKSAPTRRLTGFRWVEKVYRALVCAGCFDDAMRAAQEAGATSIGGSPISRPAATSVAA